MLRLKGFESRAVLQDRQHACLGGGGGGGGDVVVAFPFPYFIAMICHVEHLHLAYRLYPGIFAGSGDCSLAKESCVDCSACNRRDVGWRFLTTLVASQHPFGSFLESHHGGP